VIRHAGIVEVFDHGGLPGGQAPPPAQVAALRVAVLADQMANQPVKCTAASYEERKRRSLAPSDRTGSAVTDQVPWLSSSAGRANV